MTKENKFKVGDIVEIVMINNSHLTNWVGRTGVVVSIEEQKPQHYLVEFSKYKGSQLRYCCSEATIDFPCRN